MTFIQFIQEFSVPAAVVGCLLFLIFFGNRCGIKISVSFDERRDPRRRDLLEVDVTPGETTQIIELTDKDAVFPEVMAALDRGDKIAAIKLVREARSLDLTTAKQMVDLLDRNRDSLGH